ncbi:MAG TPA: hypothetical protein VMZ03_13455 [Chitinophagaceae bacterium]|nr:hypothetical protein [Chitinophagaceae bacterium]
MEKISRNSQPPQSYDRQSRPVLSQTENNTTLWIGHLQTEHNDRLAGQTFLCPSDGLVNNIQVYSAAVTRPGEITLTLHEFDEVSKSWGPPISQSNLTIEENDAAKWIRFGLEPVSLQKNNTYGFRLQANNSIVGIGEAASDAQRPFLGHEWNARGNEKGNYFHYFSLTFKVEMCA